MSELLPTVQADNIRESLLDYLTTTFALTDDDARAALVEFLTDPQHGLFKGPYVRLQLPFRPAEDGWRSTLDWFRGFPPYGHQAQAFARLSSANLSAQKPRPLPTMVTTGTGSGKTEAFLVPILDHVLRAKREGVRGLKAIVLYPMNALANDQALRLSGMLTSDPALAGVTAALYTGQAGPQRTKVSRDGLITDRAVIRSDAPDILLTNYKMLDQLLLRAEDARLWAQSATSLQYLVLDEFHTYDGAQGTDVSMLLRRLGLALKSHWSEEDPSITAEDRIRPLGRITPVATSATLGDKSNPQAMLTFAETVFGEHFPPDSVITETRQDATEWIGDAPARMAAAGYQPATLSPLLVRMVAEAVEALPALSTGREITDVVLAHLWGVDATNLAAVPESVLLDLLKAHPLSPDVLECTAEAVSASDLAQRLGAAGPPPPGAEDVHVRRWNGFVVALIAAFSHVRAAVGRDAASVDLHLWVRELTRVDRTASGRPRYLWSDDGDMAITAPEDATSLEQGPPLPALFCRHCGRSGWGAVLAPTGSDLDTDDDTIRRRRVTRDDRFRPLIHAAAEGDRMLAGDGIEPLAVDGLMWFAVRERRLLASLPADLADARTGGVLPVLTHVGDDAGKQSLDDTCPACQGKDGIRFLGSAVATQLSVTLSTLFGDAGLDSAEKKALVFTDSVQDAAHRAGFVQSRSYTLTLRSVLRDGVGDTPVSLDALLDQIILNAGDDPHRRYRIVPPEMVEREEFAPFWRRPRLRDVPAAVRTRVKRRLLLDAALEFGLQSRTGRTLERTGSAAVEVSASAAELLKAAGQAIDEAQGLPTLEGFEPLPSSQLMAWVRGVLERMRERGAIEHEWFRRYQQEDGNRYSIWGGRPRSSGMPAFPAGRPAPAFPRIGGAAPRRNSDLDPVTSAQSWYALWASKCLQVSPGDGAKLARLLLQRLDVLGVIESVTSASGAQIYQLPQSRILISAIALADLQGGAHLLSCVVCDTQVPGSRTVVNELEDAPCLVARCAGRLARKGRADNFYRRMYSSTDIRRVVAREHSGLLPDEDRLRYETQFKFAHADPSAPNVLVATPTLEMGIDIGDLSAVMLASLPRTVASYLQRVGRAGRLTGNALNLAFVTGRGEQLPRLGDPLSVINGEVRPPATYLDAEEILRRQYVASIADRLARDPQAPHPRKSGEAIGSTEPGTYLHALATDAETHAEKRLDAFLAGFPSLTPTAQAALRAWASPVGGTPGSSPLAQRLVTESHRWTHTVQTLEFRRQQIMASIPPLEQIARGPAATDDDKRAWRMAKASLKLTHAQLADLRGDYWIGVLEEHGILPNYTLTDDSATLAVSLSWVDPDSGEYQTDAFSYHRGGTQALRDFAPGATFYAGGHALKIDALDLGHNGEAVRTWVFCAACGYADGPNPSASIPSCPRCGSPEIADTKQRLEVVELDRVYSAMRRDDAVISDDRDERIREQFTVVTAADINPANVTRQWFVDGYDFGAKHLRDQTIRWLNIGKAGGQGSPRVIANGDYAASLFRVCSWCGQLDTVTGRNQSTEHRPWCPHRKALTEHTRGVALSRTLCTEGLVIRLPTSVTLGDMFAVPSLAAAILLGLRERIGGAPNHIQIASIVDPTLSTGGDNHEALLLHDVVPGGTGYLAELADPETVWTILHTAWQVLRDCECQHEQRLACHRCLLPFAAPHQVRSVSRAAGERHLRDILHGGALKPDVDPTLEMGWSCTSLEPTGFDAESNLEQRFRAVLADRLSAVGATVKDTPTSTGNRSTITVGGSGRVWTLDPQQNMLGSRPDFLLRCNQGGIPEVAIFTDGWRYHATSTINRLSDDAAKRAVLRDSGRLVLGITWADLEDAAAGTVRPPSWYRPEDSGPILQTTGGELTNASLALITGGPIDFLIGWIQNPEPDAIERLATWLPLFLYGAAQARSVIGDQSPAAAAQALLDGTPLPTASTSQDWIWRDDTVALATVPGSAMVLTTALVLDDRPQSLGETHKGAWRDWLRLSNLLNLRTRPTVITTVQQLQAPTAAPAAAPTPGAALSPDWQELWDNGTDGERQLIITMAEASIDPLPTQGEETSEGLSLGLSWPQLRLVVDLNFSDEDRVELAPQWTLVAPDLDAVVAALSPGRS